MPVVNKETHLGKIAKFCRTHDKMKFVKETCYCWHDEVLLPNKFSWSKSVLSVFEQGGFSKRMLSYKFRNCKLLKNNLLVSAQPNSLTVFLNSSILIPWFSAGGRLKASDAMTRWNVLKWRRLLARTSLLLTIPLSITFSTVAPRGAPAGLVTYCLQSPTKYGATHIKEFVTFLSRWKVTQSQRISVPQTTAWLIFTSLPCKVTSHFQMRKEWYLQVVYYPWLMGFLPIHFFLLLLCREHWVTHASRQTRWD